MLPVAGCHAHQCPYWVSEWAVQGQPNVVPVWTEKRNFDVTLRNYTNGWKGDAFMYIS